MMMNREKAGAGALAAERRRDPRLPTRLPALVRGCDAQGQVVYAEGLVTDISASGLRLELERPFGPDSELLLIVHLGKLPATGRDRLHMALFGRVLRLEQPGSTGYGLGLSFTVSVSWPGPGSARCG